MYVYHNQKEIAKHKRFSSMIRNGIRTDESHLPMPLKANETINSMLLKAKSIGPNTLHTIEMMYESAKVLEQPTMDVAVLLALSNDYLNEDLEKACLSALKEHVHPNYRDIMKHLSKKKKCKLESKQNTNQGLIRGPEYYKGDNKK